MPAAQSMHNRVFFRSQRRSMLLRARPRMNCRGLPRLLLLVTVVATLAGCRNGTVPESASPIFETVSFSSGDGLEITADWYRGVSVDAPTVLLFHQSASSRGEFREIAPRLRDLGYNALAVDLRWGRSRNEVPNETASRNGTDRVMASVEAGTGSPWATIDASWQDMIAAVDWLDVHGAVGPRYALGSSFSAMLVYRLAAENRVDGIMAYSPGEYDDSRPDMVRSWAARIQVPALSVAAPDEEDLVRPVADRIPENHGFFYRVPAGSHGASILTEDDRNMDLLVSFLGHHTGGPPRREEWIIPVGNAGNVVADWYASDEAGGTIALFHQGGGSARGEYGFLIPGLLQAGFNVLAADLHGGGDRFGFPNRTMAARPEPADFSYCDALPQMEAVIGHLRSRRPDLPLVLWGSSYSGALVLHAQSRDPEGIAAVLAFSPASGEPMRGCDANEMAGAVSAPLLLVRPDTEIGFETVQTQLEVFRSAGRHTYVARPGVHGSSALNPFRVDGDPTRTYDRVMSFLRNPTEEGPIVRTEEVIAPHYFALLVADVDRSVAWYRDAFDMESVGGSRAENDAWRIENLRSKSLFIEIIRDDRAQSIERARGFRKVGFGVSDLEKVADRIEASTGSRPRIIDFPDHGTRILQITDPDGNTLQLSSAL